MCLIEELLPGKTIEKRILARRIAVINDNGNIYGIESDCKHMKASLGSSKVSDGIVTCRWHGWKYDLKTGKCLTVAKMDLKTYQVEITDNVIFLVLG